MKKILQFVKNFYPFFVLIIATVFFFHKILVHTDEMIFPAIDTVNIEVFWRQFFIENVKKFNEIPLWNPYVFSGMPFITNPLSQMFYPVTLLFFIFPFEQTFGYKAMITIFLTGSFTYLYSRSIKLDKPNALLAAISYMFSGKLLISIYAGHLFILDTLLWLPLTLYFIEQIIQESRVASTAGLSVTIAFMIFAGHTQTIYFCLITSGLYTLLRFMLLARSSNNHHFPFKKILTIHASSLLAIGLSAIQLFPSIEFMRYSGRSGGVSYDFASSFSLHPSQIASFLFPKIFGIVQNSTFWGKGNAWESNGYIGILPLILAGIAIFFSKHKLKRIFIIIAVISLLYSFGKYTPFFSLIYNYLPLANSFRAPERFLFIYTFSMAILSGIGLQEILQLYQKKDRKTFKNILISISTICLSSVVMVLFFQANSFRQLYKQFILQDKYMFQINKDILVGYFQKDLYVFTGVSIIFLLLLFFALLKKHKVRFFILFVFSLTLVDLFLYSSPYIATEKPAAIYRFPDSFNKILRDKEQFRFLDMTGATVTYLSRSGKESITGTDPLYLHYYRDFLWLLGKHNNTPFESSISLLTIDNPRILDMLNVKYVISDKKIVGKNFQLLGSSNESIINGTNNTLYLYLNTTYLPRGLFIPHVRKVKDTREAQKIISSPLFDPKETVLLEEIPKESTDISAESEVTFLSYKPNAITMHITNGQSSYLLLSEIWYPGWKAYINSNQAKIYKANGVFRSVFIPKGNHTLELKFQPQTYYIGRVVSFVFTGFVIILLTLSFLKRSIK